MDLGFTEVRARTVTIRQFLSLWDRWIDREDRANYRAAVISAVVANSAPRGKNSRRAAKPHDIIPSLKDRQKEEVYNSPEDQVAALRMMFGDNLQIETEALPPKE